MEDTAQIFLAVKVVFMDEGLILKRTCIGIVRIGGNYAATSYALF